MEMKMSDRADCYREYNQRIEGDYPNVVSRIRDIVEETSASRASADMDPFLGYFHRAGSLLQRIAEYESRLSDSYFNTADFADLRKENKELYEELLPEAYSYSYANPEFSVAQLGDRFGQAFSYFYVRIREAIPFAFRHKVFRIAELATFFIELYDCTVGCRPEYHAALDIILKDARNPKVRDSLHDLRENFDEEFVFFLDIVEKADPIDLRYLFRYGRFISDTEIENARFIMRYPEEKLRELSKHIVKSYAHGFQRDNKDISRKSTIRFFYPLGYEKIIRYLIEDMHAIGLRPVAGNIFSCNPNQQYGHDHKFDASLYIDNDYVKKSLECFSEACELVRTDLSAYSGSVLIENFGEAPFVPQNKNASLKFSEEHHRLIQEYQNSRTEIIEKYMPRAETSFSMIAFPSPEIGERFPEIFDSIYTINTLDVEKYTKIQQRIIDALDKAKFIHVQGRNECRTDIKVKMHALSDPSTQTNFVNCGADVNIPLGEVFTSPVLEGTNGILHIEETFLNGLKFKDLKLVFENGNISDYSCSNYETSQENKKYIEENLLFPHKSLPLGEFAIGTNTLAYAMSLKFDIIRVLPILIIEKMGPHFAIGDTCFRHEEDQPVYNTLDGKEIIARDNERSLLRKECSEVAYTYCHTDITIPYESIGRITAVTERGEELDIIRDGRFVLVGTEELNIPLMEK